MSTATTRIYRESKSLSEKLLERAIKDGRATRQEIGVSLLGGSHPDETLQTRIELDVDHARSLAGLLVDGIKLNPIVLFRCLDRDPGKLLIANGFHRLRAHYNLQIENIDAWVIEGSMQEAMEFAANCNIEFSKPLSMEDKKKALRKLLEAAEDGSYSRKRLAEVCGISDRTAQQEVAKIVSENPEILGKFRSQGLWNKAVVPTQKVRINSTTVYAIAKSGRAYLYRKFQPVKHLGMHSDDKLAATFARYESEEACDSMGRKGDPKWSQRTGQRAMVQRLTDSLVKCESIYGADPTKINVYLCGEDCLVYLQIRNQLFLANACGQLLMASQILAARGQPVRGKLIVVADLATASDEFRNSTGYAENLGISFESLTNLLARHASPSTTLQFYARATEADLRAAVEALP